jgi:hypothetical protein
MIKTGRQDIYIRHVKNAEANRDGEESDGESTDSSSDDYFFQYQYELFSFGATLGFLRGEKTEKDATYSQDIRKVNDMPKNDKHRQTIDFVTRLVQVQQGVEEDEAWEEILRYADAGVEIFDEETDDDLDFVRFIEDASAEKWEQRLEETIGTTGDVGSL